MLAVKEARDTYPGCKIRKQLVVLSYCSVERWICTEVIDSKFDFFTSKVCHRDAAPVRVPTPRVTKQFRYFSRSLTTHGVIHWGLSCFGFLPVFKLVLR